MSLCSLCLVVEVRLKVAALRRDQPTAEGVIKQLRGTCRFLILVQDQSRFSPVCTENEKVSLDPARPQRRTFPGVVSAQSFPTSLEGATAILLSHLHSEFTSL